MPEILLISCYELGHQPHGIAMAAGFLERAGLPVRCVDLAVQKLTDDAIDAAGTAVISVPMHTALRLGASAARRIRARNPGCRLIFTGLYAPMNEAYLRSLGADAVLGGEHEQALVDLVRGDDAPAPIQLGKLAFAQPARDQLPPLSDYAHLIGADGEHRLVGYAETSRGCLDRCRHCPVPAVYGGRFFVVDADVVLADIARQVDAGAGHITFGDPDFLNGPGHSLEILRELHRRFPDVTFDITTQVSNLLRHRDHLAELVDLGCAFAVSAVESLSDRVLEKLAKRHRRADVDRLLELADGAGLALRPTFVTFTPWTRLADLRQLVDAIVARDLVANVDPIQLTIRLLVPPGSLLLDADQTAGAFGELDPAALTHRWQHPDPRVDRLQESLAARVAAAADGREPPHQTFAALRGLIYRACELPMPPPIDPPRRRVPRVSEPWFC